MDSVNNDEPEVEKDKCTVPQCVVCMDNRRSEILLPCLHFVSCKTCAVRIAATSICPICRATFTRIVSVRCKQPPAKFASSFTGTMLVADAICDVNKWTPE